VSFPFLAWQFPTALVLCASGAVLACGAPYSGPEYPAKPPAGVNLAEDESTTPAPPGTLWRRDVDAALDAGLGRFLQHADLEPEMQAGAFVGFKIVELRPPAWWQGIDLVPGDIVTQVNGMPIEQPTEAHAAFESLRKSDKLVVKYVRKGEPRELTLTILSKPLSAPTGH
jgi:hypothetical protein